MAKVGIIVGSLRKESYSKKIAVNVASLFPNDYITEFIEIGNLVLYNQDFDDSTPQEYIAFRNSIRGLDAVLFVTPEYNRSVPAVLKNAIDIGSRPTVENVWDGKPAAIISQSISRLSGFGATHHLRQTLAFLNMPIVQQPEIYLTDPDGLLNENGKINNMETILLLQTFVETFVELIKRYQG